MNLKNMIREVPDFPKKGISFKDITTLFKNSEALSFVIDEISNEFKNKNITKVIGLESRGFIVGGAIASNLNAGFVPIRKSGKLPAETIKESYDLEYGTDCIEMHLDALSHNDVVLLHDDLLATGGTAMAAINLIRKAGVKSIYLSFICDLEFIESDKKEEIKKYNPHVMVVY